MSKTPNLLEKLKNCSIVILGLGKEGLSSYQFLRDKFPDKKLFLLDEKTIDQLDEQWQKINKNDENIEFATSFDDFSKEFEENILATMEFNKENQVLVIKSPGITLTHPLVEQAKNLKIKSTDIKVKITSNTNIFLRLLKNPNSNLGDIKTIGVTGTKGKSTTASMIHHVLKNCGINSFLGGNIGTPPLSLVKEISKNLKSDLVNSADNPTAVVLEMSSHQLNDAMLSPSIAVILDISPEHLDYYNSFEEYVEAKSQISRFQTKNDLVIFNKDQELPTKLANIGPAKKITFSPTKNIVDGKIIYKDDKLNIEEEIIDVDQLPVLGKHNVLNTIPSIIIAKEFGCKTNDIRSSLLTFKTLPHRLEMIKNSDGITYINDSLSTTPKSTIAAIKSFNNSPIILIAGGHERNLEFDELAEIINNSNVKHLILLPDTGKKILDNVKSHSEKPAKYTFAKNMKEAVLAAKSVAKSGDIVLLSPAAASFGHFKDYKDRGEQFQKYACIN